MIVQPQHQLHWLEGSKGLGKLLAQVDKHCTRCLDYATLEDKTKQPASGTWVLKGAGRRMNCSTLTPGWKVSTSTAADTHGSCMQQ